MNLAKHLILHIFTICVNVYIISLKRAFIEKIVPIHFLKQTKQAQVAPLVSARKTNIALTFSVLCLPFTRLTQFYTCSCYVLKPIL